jgi:hypothetical protein
VDVIGKGGRGVDVKYWVPLAILSRFDPTLDHLSVTLSVGTPLCPYGIAYRRVYGLSNSPRIDTIADSLGQGSCTVQGYLAHKKTSPP